MAAFNGADYILEQANSILKCMSLQDELVISDGGSTDNTLEILSTLESSDGRVRVLSTEIKEASLYASVARNFQIAVDACVNDIVVLSDQDDVWSENRLYLTRQKFLDPECVCAVVNGKLWFYCDGDGDDVSLDESLFDLRTVRKGFLSNFVKLSVLGCQLAFRRKALSPVPMHKHISHDWWWYTNVQLKGKTEIICDEVFLYRRHGKNVSQGLGGSPNSLCRKLWARMNFLRFFLTSFKKQI